MFATIPAITIVHTETIINAKNSTHNKLLKRTSKNTPAVTKVEEWTKEETGVGAAIAAGSHDEKGIWALLVIKVIIKNKTPHSTNTIAFTSK